MKQLLISCLIFFTSWSVADEVNIKNAILHTQELILKKKDELNKLRESILKEKLELSKKVSELEEEVLNHKSRNQKLIDILDNKDMKLRDLDNESLRLSEEVQFLKDSLIEYRKNFTKNISLAELKSYEKKLSEIDQLSKQTDILSGEYFTRLMDLSLARNLSICGIKKIKGECLNKQGELKDGEFIQMGPISFFISDDESASGLTGFHLGSSKLSIQKEMDNFEIKSLIETGKGQLPIDVSLGNALKIDLSKGSLKDHIKTGGVIMIPILCLGFISFLIALWKFCQLKFVKIIQTKDLEKIISLTLDNKKKESLEFISKYNKPIRSVLEEAMEHYQNSREELEEILHETIMLQVPMLEKGLWILSVTAASAPLLGLLGTVTGMIKTFNLVTIFGAGNANLLSGGISEALITTEFGLIVAIPVLLFHSYLLKKIKYIVHMMEQASISFINGVKIGAK